MVVDFQQSIRKCLAGSVKNFSASCIMGVVKRFYISAKGLLEESPDSLLRAKGEKQCLQMLALLSLHGGSDWSAVIDMVNPIRGHNHDQSCFSLILC